MQFSNEVRKNMEIRRDGRQYWVEGQNDAGQWVSWWLWNIWLLQDFLCASQKLFQRNQIFPVSAQHQMKSCNFNVKTCSFALLLWRYILLAFRLEAVLCIVYMNQVERKECLIFFPKFYIIRLVSDVILLLGNINPLFQLFIQGQYVLLKHCNKIALDQCGLCL